MLISYVTQDSGVNVKYIYGYVYDMGMFSFSAKFFYLFGGSHIFLSVYAINKCPLQKWRL